MIRSVRAAVAAALTVFLISGCHRSTVRNMAIKPISGTTKPAYSITDIGIGEPFSLNSAGQVVGEFPAGTFPNSKGFSYSHGFLWNNGKRTEMPTFGGWYSDAEIITDQGIVVGTASVRGQTAHHLPIDHRCVWQNGRLIDLEADPRFRGGGVLHITRAGTVYAISSPQGPAKQLHLWYFPQGFAPGIRQDKGIIGGPEVAPIAINDNGMVAGNWDTGKHYSSTNHHHVKRAFAWWIGQKKWSDLGTLGGMSSEAKALNNAGQIIGSVTLQQSAAEPEVRFHPFLWYKVQMHDLGTLPGGDLSIPDSINEKGQVVGYSNENQQRHQNRLDMHPVIWEDGTVKDLSHLIPASTRWIFLSGAASINDHGQIVGDGAIAGDHWVHGYLLTPIGSNRH